jgi:FkbM family methyltransferase
LLAAQAQLRTRVQEARWRPQAVDVGDGRALVVARDGAPLVIDLHDVNLLAFTYARGVYDAPFHLLLSRLLSGSDVYVDVGANIGQFVVSAARRLSAYGRVFAYEPQPRAVRTLRLNDYLRRNAGLHQSEVIVREVAVSDSAGEVTLRIPHDHAGRASAVAGTLADVDPALITTAGVPCVTLDDDLADLSHLRLVKIDVEGHEPAVLRGMDGLVRSGRVDFVDVECVRGHLGRGLDDLGGMLASWQALGGRLQRLADDGGLVPLDGSAHAVVRQADRSHLVMDLRPLRQHGGPGTAPR